MRHKPPTPGTVPDAPRPPTQEPGATDRVRTPSQIFDLSTEPCDSRKHQAAPTLQEGLAPGKQTVAGKRHKGLTSAADAPTPVVSSQGYQPPTLPTGMQNQAADKPSGSANRGVIESQPSVDKLAAKQLPPWVIMCLIFIMGIGVGAIVVIMLLWH